MSSNVDNEATVNALDKQQQMQKEKVLLQADRLCYQ